ncbi:ABC transporter ATP-binding protein [Brachybacterium sp. MASK1Z-5]|uniref:ABC transporter ATP-binding protein n=1 Tax=Brachybacterium halotolerans TaxID=2795215 RepID=A0ABS1B8H9_9MICO|nr:ABC transporter ATP-binding protein [Brachybacterium halotolerans]MBK0330962.1 ABC transporter ATP-binding protein [Brachybacterium halotolerans]
MTSNHPAQQAGPSGAGPSDVGPPEADPSDVEEILSLQDVSVVYEPVGAAPTHAVRGVSAQIARGEFVGLVGESGSGKSTLGFAITGLATAPARIEKGRILFRGRDIASMDQDSLRSQRQGGFAMVLQSGMNALNPVRTIRKHFHDIFAAHRHVPRARREERAAELVGKVSLGPEVLDLYPDQLSGGMRQRVTIALALSLEPQLMVFDEPTTALDVMVQHAVMDTIRDLQASEGFTAILISHDLGIVLESAQRVLVMHDGEIVEDAASADILHRPRHEYTRMLLSHYADPRAEVVTLPGLEDRAVLRSDDPSDASAENPASSSPEPADPSAEPPDPSAARSAPAAPAAPPAPAASSDGASSRRAPVSRLRSGGTELRLQGVSKVYPAARRSGRAVRAVDDVSFTLEPGGATALVGQSGSGKSTIAKLITGIERPSEGTVHLGDTSVGDLGRSGLRDLRRTVQMVFQDPYAALNPLNTVEYTLARAVMNLTDVRRDGARRRVRELLETVGLTPVEQFTGKLPHQLSGGQRQRVVIARALACDPQVIIADEPVSMLDVSLRAGVLSLLRDLRESIGVSLLYITHDLLSARLITDRILVLHDGKVVESGPTARVMRAPQDDYTISLLDAIPNPRRVLTP